MDEITKAYKDTTIPGRYHKRPFDFTRWIAVHRRVDELFATGRYIDACLSQLGSNRCLMPSVFMATLMLMQHEGELHLDDVLYIQEDAALRTLPGSKQMPQADSLGNWLRRMGKHPQCTTAMNTRKAITLDIDATVTVLYRKNTSTHEVLSLT